MHDKNSPAQKKTSWFYNQWHFILSWYHVHKCIHRSDAYTYTYTHTQTRLLTYTHTHTHAQTNTFIHSHTYAHTHTRTITHPYTKTSTISKSKALEHTERGPLHEYIQQSLSSLLMMLYSFISTDGFVGRTLPHFPVGALYPAAKGFVVNSFFSGIHQIIRKKSSRNCIDKSDVIVIFFIPYSFLTVCALHS